jgi:NADH-quinone oxidoreductase subunit N
MRLDSSFNAIFPMTCVAAAALAAMMAEAFRDADERPPIGALALIGLAGAAAVSVLLWNRQFSSFGVVTADNFGLFATLVIIVVGLLTVGLSAGVVHRDRLPAGDYYALLLFSVTGMILMAMAADLLVIFLALEVMSIGVYVLTGLRRDSIKGGEAAFKYFLLGAFASAFFLYGIAFLYGATGSTRLDRIGTALAAQAMEENPLVLLGLALLLVGFAFKISAVPFHMWTPDAYQGAPTVVTAFMSTGVKAAAFAAFARVFLSALEPLRPDWAPIVASVAVATMILGTVVGVAQTSVRRMLAYSSIAHAGYILVALVAGNDVGKGAILFYLLAYAVTNLGAFGVLALLGSEERPLDDLRDFAGLWHSRPGMAALLAVFLLSLGGIPPTAGFVAKWYVFSAAVSAGSIGLALVGVLTSVVSVFFYLRVVVMMYMAEPAGRPAREPLSGYSGAALAVSLLLVLYLGVLPTRLLALAAASVSTLF